MQGVVVILHVHVHTYMYVLVHVQFRKVLRLVLTRGLCDVGEKLRQSFLQNFEELWEVFEVANNTVKALDVSLGQLQSCSRRIPAS